MFKIGDKLTTIEKQEYPYLVEVREMNQDCTRAKCLCSDPSGDAYKEYALTELRYISAKELHCDVFAYYSINEPSEDMEFYSDKHISWLKNYVASEKNHHCIIEKACEKFDWDIADLPSSKLHEYDMTGERAAWVSEVVALIEKEIDEVKNANLAEEISARFAAALENEEDELDFYMDLLEDDIDVDVVRRYMGDECAFHMRKFCEEHGLLIESPRVKVNLQALHDAGGSYFVHFGGKTVYSEEDDTYYFKEDGPEQRTLLRDGEEVVVFNRTSDAVVVISVDSECKVWLSPEEFATISLEQGV